MGNLKECFVCGRLVAMAENKFFDVTSSDGTRQPREACSVCYYKAVAHGSVMASHNGRKYECQPRTMQRELFGRTYRHLRREGGKHV